jgi:chromosome segregation protein
MQLTRLEIKGFKSFGDKVTINFGEGITGIVGPNGCGKSNVVDAIRWVLGEQKISNLRSEKLENIIFNGTKKRKPTQMAEVSLSFVNTKNLLPVEYNEVTIARRFYRSGDSEYLLNGINCRLKDITNLFLDTGISSNSYAIIELGMVDDILNDKDNSRRHLFEEAAGISKFKIRKKETLRKLDDTDADLERVADLLFEIEKNMRSLERQAAQTQRYYRIREEYKYLSIELAKKSIQHQAEALDTINRQLGEESDRKTSLVRQAAEKEAQIAKARAGLIDQEKLLASRQRVLNEHQAKIRHYESEKKIKHERLKYLSDKSELLKEQIGQDKQSNQRASFAIQSLRQDLATAEVQGSEISGKLEQLKAEKEDQKVRTDALQAEVQVLEGMVQSRRDEMYRLTRELDIQKIQIASLEKELERESTDSSSRSASAAEFDLRIAALQEELGRYSGELEALKAAEALDQERIAGMEKNTELIRDERQSLSRRLDARQNEYNLLKSLVDNLEGFPEAIRFLRKKTTWNKKAPLLSDIISCDEKFRVVIENYLEPFMNHYIVQDESEAYEAINLLSEAAKGRAHFFLLSKFEKFHPSEPRLFDHAIPATEVVEYDAKYKKLVSFVLDGVYIVTGSENSIPSDDEHVFITLNGKITRRRFSLSGGSVGLFEGKRIGRAKNLEKLQQEIKELQQKIDLATERFNEQLSELEALKKRSRRSVLESTQSAISRLEQQLITLQTRKDQVLELVNNSQVKREDIQGRIEIFRAESAGLSPMAEEARTQLAELESRLQGFSAELAGFAEMLEIRSKAFNDENIHFHQHQNKINSLRQEISFKESTFETNRERIEKNQQELLLNEEAIRSLLESNEIQEDELVALYQEKDAIEQGVREAETSYYGSRGAIDELEKEARQVLHLREQSDELTLGLREKLNDIKLSMNAVRERLMVEFEADLDAVISEESPAELRDLSAEELQDKIGHCRERLDRIGPINPMAMEAYEEIKQRYDFINTQKEDLLKAKESLMTTIEEIDLVARETFLNAFRGIKENFIRVFRSLFTDEDDCDLRLADPTNPLESAIEIIAKPKGKKPLSINQLSGGEKTLTATSLLFAFYLLKPAPFCIFDEVDAPLDDANIDKFNAIVRKFSEESQFIIVTHNKRTMSSTDVIYGITMVEQGVSQVVPVDLRELA